MLPEHLPIAESCLRNQDAILSAFNEVLHTESGEHSIAEDSSAGDSNKLSVLEIGSGTGQHAVHIVRHLPDLEWQPSELPDSLPAVEAWREHASLPNVLPVVELDVNQHPKKQAWVDQFGQVYDYCFTANTIHFISQSSAENLLACASLSLKKGGRFLVYGPFNQDGKYTSEGNRRLDDWLRVRDPESGIKDEQWLINEAQRCGLVFSGAQQMPANNRFLSFIKSDRPGQL